MRFTLHYEGPLAAAGSTKAKQRIRQELEPQLKELWSYPPLVDSPGETSRFLVPPGADSRGNSDERSYGFGFDTPCVLIPRFGHTFAALVSEPVGLAAELDILMLRPAEPGQIIVGGGDIDNRLKTLFDSLSAPQQAQQLPDDARPTSATDPFYVLLDDDNRITRVNVETDRLLAPESADHVRLFIRVQTRIVAPMISNIELGLN
jgi:hypothetical protein